MENKDVLKKEDLSKILAYVVTQVEGEAFECITKRVLLPSKYFNCIEYYGAIIRCIVNSDRLKEFNNTIDENYHKWGEEFYIDNPSVEDYNNVQNILESGDDLYTVLYIEEPVYSDDDKLIKINGTNNHLTDSLRDVLVLKNPRFSYLNELLDELINYQESSSSYIDYEEMKIVANKYLNERNTRKLTK